MKLKLPPPVAALIGFDLIKLERGAAVFRLEALLKFVWGIGLHRHQQVPRPPYRGIAEFFAAAPEEMLS